MCISFQFSDELKHVLNITKPKFFICSPQSYETYQRTVKNIDFIKKIIVFGEENLPSAIAFKELISNKVNPEDFIVADVQVIINIHIYYNSISLTGTSCKLLKLN